MSVSGLFMGRLAARPVIRIRVLTVFREQLHDALGGDPFAAQTDGDVFVPTVHKQPLPTALLTQQSCVALCAILDAKFDVKAAVARGSVTRMARSDGSAARRRITAGPSAMQCPDVREYRAQHAILAVLRVDTPLVL